MLVNPSRPAYAKIVLVSLLALMPVGVRAQAGSNQAQAKSALPANFPKGQMVVLDHVVAAINGDVILESDVREEMRFAALQPYRNGRGRNTPTAALQRLIDRDLILQQMTATQATVPVPTKQQIEEQLDGLRKQIPDCAEQHCETESGWQAFLAAHGLTESEVEEHWRQRMMILSFIQARFGAGIRVSKAEIEDYYNKDFAPEFARRKLPPPPLQAVSSRISEIILQQHVNVFLQDWLQSLKDEGNVSILSAAYSEIGKPTGAQEENTGDEP